MRFGHSYDGDVWGLGVACLLARISARHSLFLPLTAVVPDQLDLFTEETGGYSVSSSCQCLTIRHRSRQKQSVLLAERNMMNSTLIYVTLLQWPAS